MTNKEKGIAFEGSLWVDCLLICHQRAINLGRDVVDFSEVDKMVIERSKRITQWKVCDE